MTKLDYQAGKKAVDEIIKNSAKIENIAKVASSLNESLQTATQNYKEISDGISKLEKEISDHLNAKFDGLTKDLDNSIEVKLAERLSEVSIRLKDLTDQQIKNGKTIEELNEKSIIVPKAFKNTFVFGVLYSLQQSFVRFIIFRTSFDRSCLCFPNFDRLSLYDNSDM